MEMSIGHPDSTDFVQDYALRWGIETLFGIFKTRGFCLESTHFTDHKRLRKLFALLTLALVWSLKTGLEIHQLHPIPLKKHGRRAKSLFRLGSDHLILNPSSLNFRFFSTPYIFCLVLRKLQYSSLKTIAAFLNTEGGVLIIGVEDNGNIYGLENDIQCLKNGSLDKFERHLVQLIENNIGKRFLSSIKIRFTTIEDKNICAVYIQKANQKAFLKSDKGTEFYIRTANSSRSLNAPDIYDYF